MPLLKAPSNSSMRRTINYSTIVNSNGSGAVTTQVDPSLAVSLSADWTASVALFGRVKVDQVRMLILPNFFTTNSTPSYFGSMIAYYDPQASAIVTSYALAMDYVPHVVTSSLKPGNFNVRLRNALGTTTPIVVSSYVANFLGSLNFVAPNGAFPNSISVATILFSFVCTFSEQK